MCSPRRLTEMEMIGFPKWKMQLEAEDVKEFGEVVKRPLSAYHELYRMFLDKKQTSPS